jgi:uncharacterized protein
MELKAFFTENPKFAIAFSGGVDSSYLLYAAKTFGCDVKAYFIKSAFQPQFELDDAKKLAYMLSVPMTVETLDSLESPEIVSNQADRCYHCKKAIFTRLMALATDDGYTMVCDGTNASDDNTERAGMRALEELGVRSPLRECGMTKKEVRRLSREVGLFTHDKPSYACLATRIPTGTEITEEQLKTVEAAEHVMASLGFSDFRIRMIGKTAKIQIPEPQFRQVIDRRKKVLEVLRPYFDDVLLDLSPRKTEVP